MLGPNQRWLETYQRERLGAFQPGRALVSCSQVVSILYNIGRCTCIQKVLTMLRQLCIRDVIHLQVISTPDLSVCVNSETFGSLLHAPLLRP